MPAGIPGSGPRSKGQTCGRDFSAFKGKHNCPICRRKASTPEVVRLTRPKYLNALQLEALLNPFVPGERFTYKDAEMRWGLVDREAMGRVNTLVHYQYVVVESVGLFRVATAEERLK